LRGCECGNRMFLYFRKLTSDEAAQLREKKLRSVASRKFARIISEAEKKRREGMQKLRERVSGKPREDIWNIKVKDGVYEIDVSSLMKKEPIIVAGEEGEYLVSLSSAFETRRNLKKYTELLRK